MNQTTGQMRDFYSQFKDENEYGTYQKYQKVAKENGFQSTNDMVKRINELRNNVTTAYGNAKTKNIPVADVQNQLKGATDELNRLTMAYNQVEHGQTLSENKNAVVSTQSLIKSDQVAAGSVVEVTLIDSSILKAR
jgi:LysM repeat protein